jgi:S-adenosylmethionine hydrolase
MSIITLLTDFGLDDEYVGVMKGVILSVNPLAGIVDITHRVDPQDLISTAYLIKSYFQFFPEGTVHIVVVDPGVGSDRPIIAAEICGHIFLSPDNGALTLLFKECSVQSIVYVENKKYFLNPISRTFHGRDIFAPVGAYLSSGVGLTDLGRPVDRDQITLLNINRPCISEKGELEGVIISIDRFGNLITDIDSVIFEKFCKSDPGKNPMIFIGKHKVNGLFDSYASVKPRDSLGIIGSRGLLEIAINQGSAERFFSAIKGDIVKVTLLDNHL